MDHNSRFLYKNFRKYYKENTPILPDRFTKKEFGFFYFEKNIIQRHLGFKDLDELKLFMITQVPAHSYYSTAYYRYPTRPTMEDKEWMGAELIFDLDADHLEGADEMTYEEMMVQIRSEMMDLVDSYLVNDLGFSNDDIYLTFSGGRGYHAHIKNQSILTLKSAERRELVDFITCCGLDMNWVFPSQAVPTGQYRAGNVDRVNVSKFRLIPSAEDGGWKKRMRDGLMDVTEDLCTMEVKDFKKKYPAIKSSKSISNFAEDVGKTRESLFEMNSMVNLKSATQDFLVKIMEENVAPSMAGEVDKPVTPDIKRIIRLPGSVHGKTGLRVTPITRDELTTFDPLQSAIPSVYSGDSVKISMRKKMEIKIKGETFKLEGETEVPEYAAMFLIGRKVADLGYNSERKDSLF